MSTLSSILSNFRYCLKYSKKNTIFSFICKIILGLMMPIQVFVISRLLDLHSMSADLKIFVIALSFNILIERLLNAYSIHVDGLLELDLDYGLSFELINDISEMELQNFESPKTRDLINRVSRELAQEVFSGYIAILDFIKLLVKVIGLVLVVSAQVWYLGILMVLFSVPLIYFSVKSGNEQYKGTVASEQLRSQYDYFTDLIVSKDSALERIIFNSFHYLNDKWKSKYKEWFDINYSSSKRFVFQTKLSSILMSFLAVVCMFLLIKPTLEGKITTGVYIAVVGNVYALVQLMSWSLSNNLSDIARWIAFNNEYEDFKRISRIELNNNKNINIEKIEKIEFKNVSFKYPETDKEILKNVNLVFETGKSYGLVGENGSGKTTLIKLLTGIYSNFTGEILINGIDIRNLQKEVIGRLFSVVFQDFAKYEISLRENISLGNETLYQKEEINRILSENGLSNLVSDLQDGIDTKLGRLSKESIGISGGQWQRVAIARCLSRPGTIKILDEPTASIDPIEESRIYEKFKEIAQNETTILITHRLGATKIVDHLFVLKDGSILESGTHNELMNFDGYYSKMYCKQRSFYEKK